MLAKAQSAPADTTPTNISQAQPLWSQGNYLYVHSLLVRCCHCQQGGHLLQDVMVVSAAQTFVCWKQAVHY